MGKVRKHKSEPNSYIFLESSQEAVVRRCSVKKVFLEISQNSQENTCARDSFLINFIKKDFFFIFDFFDLFLIILY